MEKITSRRECKKIQAQAQLTEAAMKLFAEKGFEHTTVAEIAELADLATGTFYNYFQSKEDVVRHALSVRMSGIEAEFEAITASKQSSAEKIMQLALATGQIFASNRKITGLVSKLPPISTPPHGSNFKRILVSVIQEGQQNGELNPDMPVDVFCEAFMAMIQSALSSKLPLDMDSNLKCKIRLLLYGAVNGH